uniref:Uncharacterized protein n=1 Tax=Spironucleus salmonicida TaxID=348837 RepID=V6LWE2_9EUKA|eukprot:EST48947.1 Hypothetical protein SS50377_10791 [Spironucleus salmonicida]
MEWASQLESGAAFASSCSAARASVASPAVSRGLAVHTQRSEAPRVQAACLPAHWCACRSGAIGREFISSPQFSAVSRNGPPACLGDSGLPFRAMLPKYYTILVSLRKAHLDGPQPHRQLRGSQGRGDLAVRQPICAQQPELVVLLRGEGVVSEAEAQHAAPVLGHLGAGAQGAPRLRGDSGGDVGPGRAGPGPHDAREGGVLSGGPGGGAHGLAGPGGDRGLRAVDNPRDLLEYLAKIHLVEGCFQVSRGGTQRGGGPTLPERGVILWVLLRERNNATRFDFKNTTNRIVGDSGQKPIGQFRRKSADLQRRTPLYAPYRGLQPD